MSTFPKFSKAHTSLLAKHLTEPVFNSLVDKRTKNNFTIIDAINSGIQNPDSGIGVYAGDLESYHVFKGLFEPIITDYHQVSIKEKHISDLDSTHFEGEDLDPNGAYILSTRIRVGRNIQGFPLGTIISKTERNEVENMVSTALLGFSDDLSGKYYPLSKMDDATEQRLISDHFLFKSGDRFLTAAGLNRDWPSGRGIFHNDNKTFLVWINEEDQLRIISMQKGGDIKSVFDRLIKGIKKIEESISFIHDEFLGYISSCPTNLGTAMRASVHIKLPKLASDYSKFEAIVNQYQLQIRGIHGEHSKSDSGIFDISNKRRLGITEVACIQDLYDGVAALIKAEQSME